MQRSSPFSRANNMMALIAAAMSLPIFAQQKAMAEIGPYQSRGKGKGHGATGIAAKARHVGRSKYRPHQGTGEIARRQTQIARGMLSPVHAA